jgi:hypothetical protein
MSYNGSGTFQINTSGQPVVTGTVISSTAFNALTADLATGLSTAITKDGQTATTVRIPFAQGINSSLTTDTSSGSTGSIFTAGGVGIAKALYVGTNATVAGALGVTGVTTVQAGTAAAPAITTSGDTNTGIFFPAADTIAFVEGGAEAMRIDSSGNVGIGTSSPTAGYKLDVAGAIRTTSNLFRSSYGTVVQGTSGNSSSRFQAFYGAYTSPWANHDVLSLSVNYDAYTGTYDGALKRAAAIQLAAADGSTPFIRFLTGEDASFLERMRIDSAGNVGIGTNSPTSTLDVLGAIRSRGSVTPTFSLNDGTIENYLRITSSQLQLVVPSANPITFLTTNAERMRIDSTGNVGIGTTTPVAQLGVYGAGQTTAAMSTSSGLGATLYVRDSGGASGNGGAVMFGAIQGAFAAIKGFITDGANNTLGAIAFSNRNASTDATLTERMRINADGNVGIGTTSISALLHVAKGTAATLNYPSGTWASKIYYQDDVAAGGLVVGNRYASESVNVFEVGSLFGSGTAWGSFYRVTGSGTHVWGTSNSGTERMRLDSSGRLIIGATGARASESKLEVRGPANTGLSIYMFKDTQVEVNMGFGGGGDSNFYINSGSATIGTSGVYLTNGGNSWNSVSDERMKTIIEPIENAAAKVATFRTVMGYYNNDVTQTRRPFLIAQDVQKVLPEAVNVQNFETGTLGMSYTDIIPLLAAAIKELKTIVDKQADEINALKTKVGT